MFKGDRHTMQEGHSSCTNIEGDQTTRRAAGPHHEEERQDKQKNTGGKHNARRRRSAEKDGPMRREAMASYKQGHRQRAQHDEMLGREPQQADERRGQPDNTRNSGWHREVKQERKQDINEGEHNARRRR